MWKPKIIVPAILFVLFVIVLLQNNETVAVEFFFWDVTMSKVVFIPILMTLGFVLGFVVAKLTGGRGAPGRFTAPGPPPSAPL